MARQQGIYFPKQRGRWLVNPRLFEEINTRHRTAIAIDEKLLATQSQGNNQCDRKAGSDVLSESQRQGENIIFPKAWGIKVSTPPALGKIMVIKIRFYPRFASIKESFHDEDEERNFHLPTHSSKEPIK
ncbi:MAG: hypothetical protein AAB323_00645 [Pseudomonadota bacterium]